MNPKKIFLNERVTLEATLEDFLIELLKDFLKDSFE